MKTLKQLLEARAVAWDKAKALREKVAEENRDMTIDERSEWGNILSDVESLSQQIEDEERSRRIDATVSGASPVSETEDRQTERGDTVTNGDEQYRAAFNAYLRGGLGAVDGSGQDMLQQREVRAQGTGTDAAGGYLSPDEFQSKLIEVILSHGGLLAEVGSITTETGNKMTWPTVDDTTNKGVIVDENTQVSEQDVRFGTLPLDVFMYTSKIVRVSRQLLQDSAVDIEGLLTRLLGERIRRALSEHIVSGNGTSQPQGILTGAASIDSGAAGEVSYGDLVRLEHSIDPAYRSSAKYALSDDALSQLQLAVDAQNRPLWAPSIAAGVASTINGRPYFVDNDLPKVEAGKKPILYGDFKQAYLLRDVTGSQVLRLTERYADFLQVGFLGFHRFGGGVQNRAAAKALEIKA